MTELKCLYHAHLEIMVEGQHMLAQLKDGQIKRLASLMLDASPTLACIFW